MGQSPTWGELRDNVLPPFPSLRLTVTVNQTLDEYAQDIVEGRRKA